MSPYLTDYSLLCSGFTFNGGGGLDYVDVVHQNYRTDLDDEAAKTTNSTHRTSRSFFSSIISLLRRVSNFFRRTVVSHDVGERTHEQQRVNEFAQRQLSRQTSFDNYNTPAAGDYDSGDNISDDGSIFYDASEEFLNEEGLTAERLAQHEAAYEQLEGIGTRPRSDSRASISSCDTFESCTSNYEEVPQVLENHDTAPFQEVDDEFAVVDFDEIETQVPRTEADLSTPKGRLNTVLYDVFGHRAFTGILVDHLLPSNLENFEYDEETGTFKITCAKENGGTLTDVGSGGTTLLKGAKFSTSKVIEGILDKKSQSISITGGDLKLAKGWVGGSLKSLSINPASEKPITIGTDSRLKPTISFGEASFQATFENFQWS